MTQRTSFFRKIIYGVLIMALLFPIAWLSMPATARTQGGKLAQIRSDPRHPFTQASLGEVDPASETIKLATLGLRGIAVNALWQKAKTYQMKEDWTSLTATLEQLAKLQPNFISFWKFQAWNLTYNVSVEFDDFRDRYYYVRRGIQFLEEGERYNADNPHLLWDLGWFVGQKIGRADEHVQYRRLYKNDDDVHPPDRLPDQRDNWLVAKEWYLKGIDAVDNKGRSLDKKPPRIFYSSPAMSQLNYAEAIEEEGHFDKARRAWIEAEKEWEDFGQVVIEHSTGVPLRLGDEPRLTAEVARLQAELDALAPGLREQLKAQKRAALTDDERAALDTPADRRTTKQMELVYSASPKLEVTDRELAERIAKDQPEKEKQALKTTVELEQARQVLRYTQQYKNDANYDYWLMRAQLEQTDNALAAREAMFLAARAFREGDLLKARELYEKGFAKWRLVFDQFPQYIESESSTADDLITYILQYRDVLDQLDERLGDDFPLWDVVERFDNEQKLADELQAHKQRTGQAPAETAETP